MAALDGDSYLTVRGGEDAQGRFWEIGVIGHGSRSGELAEQVAAEIAACWSVGTPARLKAKTAWWPALTGIVTGIDLSAKRAGCVAPVPHPGSPEQVGAFAGEAVPAGQGAA